MRFMAICNLIVTEIAQSLADRSFSKKSGCLVCYQQNWKNDLNKSKSITQARSTALSAFFQTT